MAMLTVENLNVYYGMIHALKDVSFEVNQGEIVALIGANGAGKTTTLHTVSGMLPAKSGSVKFEGKEIIKTPGHQIVSLGMSHVPEGRRVFAGLSVYENLKMGAARTRRRLQTRWKWSIPASRASRSVPASWPVPCRAANSRCLQWVVRSWHIPRLS